MIGKLRYYLIPILTILFISTAETTLAQQEWTSLFKSSQDFKADDDSTLTFSEALQYVASNNPILKAFDNRIKAAEGNLKQAGLRPNPELSIELEEFGWNAPGFKESEFVLGLSQEFDLFGLRSALKNVATTEIEASRVKLHQNAFDLYLEVKKRFYALAHAQEQVYLSQNSLELAQTIFENIKSRLEQGAALQSELLLAELESQKSKLELLQAKQNVDALEYNLVALWNGEKSGVLIQSNKEPDIKLIQSKIEKLSADIETTREVVLLKNDLKILKAEKIAAIKEGKPALTLSGGFKRFEVDNSKSFLFGVSMPLPFFNKNQGERQRISSEIQALELEIENERLKTKAELQASIVYLNQLIERHSTLDSILLPTSQKAYSTLESAYKSGRVPYTQLLEAERALIDLSYEHNDILLDIQNQIMSIEMATGKVLRFDKE